MIGPGENIGGGIWALIETFLPALRQQVDLLYFSTVDGRPLKKSGKFTAENLLIAGSQYIRFLLAVLKYRPNIVHLHTSQGNGWLKDTFYILVSKGLGCRVILHMHGGNFHLNYNQSPRIIRWYTRRLLQMADMMIAVSGEWQNRLENIIPNGRIITLLNCVDVNVIKPPSCTENLPGPVHALFLGRVGPLKGTFDLIKALGIIRSRDCPLHTWIAGDEERHGDLKKAQTELDELGLTDTCDLLGYIDQDRKNQLLKEASIFILPSYYECLPMSVLEAMAAGLPIIATPVGGIPEVVENGSNGYLVPIGDIQSLADKIADLVVNYELRTTMGRRSRWIAERDFDAKSYVDKLVSLYTSI